MKDELIIWATEQELKHPEAAEVLSAMRIKLAGMYGREIKIGHHLGQASMQSNPYFDPQAYNPFNQWQQGNGLFGAGSGGPL